jgi:hypothetical protein
MNEVPGLSERLRSIVEYELARGNSIVRVDKPAGTRCPLAVVFAKPLDITGFKGGAALPPGIDTWENRDRHYPLETGYVCERTRHAISGPIQ